jgi:hypothetical protein
MPRLLHAKEIQFVEDLKIQAITIRAHQYLSTKLTELDEEEINAAVVLDLFQKPIM